MLKNKLSLIIIFLLFIFAGLALFYFKKPVATQIVVTNFQECVSAGNPIMESYPRQCNADGKNYTEFIGNVLEKADKININQPLPNATVTSPLVVTGQARGTWFFEASFPVFLTDWDGKIITQGIAQAQSDWMTTEFVPYTATLTYVLEPSYSNRGTLILKKDNPSGLPENDDALEIPVLLK